MWPAEGPKGKNVFLLLLPSVHEDAMLPVARQVFRTQNVARGRKSLDTTGPRPSPIKIAFALSTSFLIRTRPALRDLGLYGFSDFMVKT